MKNKTPRLQITESNGKTYVHLLTDKDVSIGRSDENVIVFFDPKVSRNHAKITLKEKNYILADLGSFNGTQVNKEFINSVVLM